MASPVAIRILPPSFFRFGGKAGAPVSVAESVMVAAPYMYMPIGET
jgi:hypothetical protein